MYVTSSQTRNIIYIQRRKRIKSQPCFSQPFALPFNSEVPVLTGTAPTYARTVDLGGSLAVASRGLYSTGVSTDLNVTYLSSGGKIGDVLRGEVTCDKFGKTIAYTTTVFRSRLAGEGEGKEQEKGERVVARGSHTKYVALAWRDERNVVEEMSRDEDAEAEGERSG